MMRKFVRALARTGRDSDIWPVALLLFAVLVPAVCLVWFMNAAMRNERLAAQQKLLESYRAQLATARTRLEDYWQKMARELQEIAHTTPPALAFAKALKTGLADSVALFDERGRVTYPNAPSPGPLDSNDTDPIWQKASWLEYRQGNFRAAAEIYHKLVTQATNANTAARALQAEARCLVRARQTNAAVRLVQQAFADERYHDAIDAQGRLIAANVELMAYELSRDQTLGKRLQRRLTDYHNPVLAAPQRRFLMKELRALSPDIEFPTLQAEDWAAQTAQSAGDSAFYLASEGNLWRFTTPDRRIAGLFETERLATKLEQFLGRPIKLIAPGKGHGDALMAIAAGQTMPGWQMEILDKGAPQPPIPIYFWTAMLVLSAMAVLAFLAARLMRRHVALAKLKNDLAATVSHELKTPLSSMRVLVDTLLDSEKLNERTTREYLELIARENDRLSRLINNFLTFSRIEHNKQRFDFKPVPVGPIIDGAARALPGRAISVDVQPDLPEINADPEAIGTALVNLLENACKFSSNRDHITVCAHANNGSVVVSVRDRGVGIAPRELKKIFTPFYQVDQTLSRRSGGCGLGLSIVQSIVTAHHGMVTVESQPGHGSTFSISLPAAKHD